MGQRATSKGDGPGTDAEVIPPDRTDKRAARGKSGIWIFVERRGEGHHAYVAPGPFAVILALLVFGILLTAALLFLLGTLLIWIPVLGVLVAVLLLSSLLRGYFRRLR
jgi:hypothetical protein